ncbi:MULTISPECIES: NYN domain-containing protein [Pantoea]|uniref:NYN domain-containing protein n=1 Tax=Pantoea TaxID=53335 RepID=UPI001980E8A8|nr:NYN domain-containing protein [Pantoea ananatis]MDJ0033738.1 NYN domain-containing protein [Pantoea ananatis]
MRTAYFVDGYNLFYGLLAGTPHKWLNLPALLAYITNIQNLESFTDQVNYFTSPVLPALATRGVASKEAQDTYIRALKANGVAVHLGRHRLEHGRAPSYTPGEPPSRLNKVDIWDLEEKETDVSIAIAMYRLLSLQHRNNIDQAVQQIVLVSADTDMTPALKAIKDDFPEVTVGIILPHREGIDRGVPGSLKNYSHWIRRNVKTEELQSHQFPPRVPTNKKPADKPNYW